MKYALAGMLMLGAMAGISAQAAEITPPAAVKSEVAASGLSQKVWWHNRWRSHHRWGSWGGGWHNRWRSHHRWGSWHRW